MLTFQVEAWASVLPEMQELWPAHWEEIASDKDRITLDPDLDRYAAMDAQGAIHVIAARRGSELVGYSVWIVSTLLHYKGTLAGISDIYWLRPDCRKGFAGIRLLKEGENHLRSLGVTKLFSGTKRWMDVGSIFARLGWSHTERLYSKYIGN